VIPEIGLDLSGVKEIVTYATRGMEPMGKLYRTAKPINN